MPDHLLAKHGYSIKKETKAKKNRQKKAYFMVHLISGSWRQNALFIIYFVYIYVLPEKISLLRLRLDFSPRLALKGHWMVDVGYRFSP